MQGSLQLLLKHGSAAMNACSGPSAARRSTASLALSPLPLGLYSRAAQIVGLEPLQVFERGAATRIAVVGVTDPYAQDQKGSLKQWYQSLLPTFEQSGAEADLVVAMADVGAPGRASGWPSDWPKPMYCSVPVVRTCGRYRFKPPRPAAVGCRCCLPDAAAVAYCPRCKQVAGHWQFDGHAFPAFARYLSPAAQMRASQLQVSCASNGRPRSVALDQPSARAPQAMWRRDTRGGSWDRLLHQALAACSLPVLLPGLRYDYPLAAGEAITREHLISLTGWLPGTRRRGPGPAS